MYYLSWKSSTCNKTVSDAFYLRLNLYAPANTLDAIPLKLASFWIVSENDTLVFLLILTLSADFSQTTVYLTPFCVYYTLLFFLKSSLSLSGI